MKQLAVAILSLDPNVRLSFGKKIPAAFYRALVVGIILFLFFAEVIRVYLVMPFPGSQQTDTVDLAYWISRNIHSIRLAAAIITGFALIRVFQKGLRWERIALLSAILLYLPVAYLFNFRFNAESIFHQPSVTAFQAAAASEDKSKLVIAVTLNGESKAYPIQLIGYHHQVMDRFGSQPVIVTYCTVCRTGRVYSTEINGHKEKFTLVGMDHFNAVFEDETTHSWWQQATGEAIAGPRKGMRLTEIPSQQLTIDSWLRQQPDGMVLAPDPLYDERYFRLEDYDRGRMQSELVKRDYQSWKDKSWVIGVKHAETAKAYDWNEVVQKRVIQDNLQTLPILLAMETDTTSFHVYDRRINGAVLQFKTETTGNQLTDLDTQSTWTMDGLCIAGPLKGQQLARVQAYNEFWHSWKKFQGVSP